MNVSAINCSPIKPQVSFGDADVDKAKKVLSLSRDLDDSFAKKDEEGNNIKSPLHTAISVGGAVASMFALGLGIGKLGYRANAKFGLVQKGKNAIGKVSNFVKNKAPKLHIKAPVIKEGSFINKAKNVADDAVKYVKSTTGKLVEKHGAEKVFATGTGLAAVATLVPDIITVDKNKNGVADIAEKKINAYEGALSSARIFSEIVTTLS